MKNPSPDRQRSLAFHVEQDDYFGTLATVLDLTRQQLRRLPLTESEIVLQRMRDDLIFLQRTGHVVQKKTTAPSKSSTV